MAAERDIDAVIDVSNDALPARIDIWVFADQGGERRTEVAHIVLVADAENAPERLAIRAIDALRARLAEIDLAAKEKRTARPAGQPPPTVAESPPRTSAAAMGHVDLQAGAAMLTQHRWCRARAHADRADRVERSPVARAAGDGGGIR